jgi:hypothetical protein
MARDEVYQEAQEKIAEALRTGAVVLDLSGNQLTALPAEVAQLKNLKVLKLRSNLLTELPAEIGLLSSLTELDLSHNHLTELPTEIGQLRNLTWIDLRDNQLIKLPAEIGKLRGLTVLFLMENQLTELPLEIGHLPNSTTLALSSNPLNPDLAAAYEKGSEALLIYLRAEPEILTLLQQGESSTVEFKSTARWNLKDGKKDRDMEEEILKTIAAFLNSKGGILLIGVADDSSIVGLDPDYESWSEKCNRDGYERWLMNDLLLRDLGKVIIPYLTITFHTAYQKDICKMVVTPASEPVYVEIVDKSNPAKKAKKETFFIRPGNSTHKLDKPSDLYKYFKQRWPWP